MLNNSKSIIYSIYEYIQLPHEILPNYYDWNGHTVYQESIVVKQILLIKKHIVDDEK